VAFIDDDAYPDSLWLKYLVLGLIEDSSVGVGGPNLPPPKRDWRDNAMAHAPGGPNPVLISDRIAEHIPGCNMMFRKDALLAISGFDPVFRAAGDDVDLCWRLRERGGVIGFSPAALVWHHRRSSIRRYWKQQVGYGRAEALLEKKSPEKYNVFGQLKWQGRIYGRGISRDLSLLFVGRVYSGVWGTAPFQSLYQSNGSFWSLMLMPEWYLITASSGLLFILSIGWVPWFFFGSLFLLAITLPIIQASINVRRSEFSSGARKIRWRLIRSQSLLLLLHVLQPLARLRGRLGGGLTPWRRHGPRTPARVRPVTMTMWRDEREAPEVTLNRIQTRIQDNGGLVRAGGNFDSWDLEVWGGLFGGSLLRFAVEEHAPGKQLLRFKVSPAFSRLALALALIFVGMSVGAALSSAWIASAVSGLVAALIVARTIGDGSFAGGILQDVLKRSGASE